MNKFKAIIISLFIMAGLIACSAPQAEAASQQSAALTRGTIYMYHDSNLQGGIAWGVENPADCARNVNRFWNVWWPANIQVSSLSILMPYSQRNCNMVGVQSGTSPNPWSWKCVNRYDRYILGFGSSPGNWYNDNVIRVALTNNPGCLTAWA